MSKQFFKNKLIHQYWYIWTELYYNTTFKTGATLVQVTTVSLMNL